jgi:hypothetical protein
LVSVVSAMTNQAGGAPGAGGGALGPRPRHRTARGTALLAVLALIAAGVSVGVSSCSGGPAPAPAPAPATSVPALNPLTGEGAGGRVLAVKIDNVGVAKRQQTGLNSADLVYVIRVEGGLSRYLVIFDSAHAPARVGPVRSARQSDIPLLAAFGRVGLAYSGAISGLLPDLAAADLRNITPLNAAAQFSNGGRSPTYLEPHRVFAAYPDLAATKDAGFRFGAAPPGGLATRSFTASMPSAAFTFTADGTRWLVSVDGSPATTADQGRTNTDNVIVQHVRILPGKYTDHNAGHPDNEVFSQTTGEGTAEFYRDGAVWHGHWSKPADTSPTDYTVNDAPMQFRPGRTWIVLVGDA